MILTWYKIILIYLSTDSGMGWFRLAGILVAFNYLT